jgi:hypothetical protein
MKKSKLLNMVLFVMVICILGTNIGYAQQKDLEKISADRKQAEATQKLLGEAQRQVGMPNITNFQQRKLMKWIFELADRTDLITYTYIKNMQGQLIFVGKSMGYGVPFSAQFTNPKRIWDMEREGGAKNKYEDNGEIQVLPQADPNGLFMPTSSSATWVIMIDPGTGEPYPEYWEPEIVVSPYPKSKFLGKKTVILPAGFNSEDDWGKK